MATFLVIMYAFYFILVGARGNATQFLTMVSEEKTFLYWVVVLGVILALWNSSVATGFARALAGLIVVGWAVGNGGRNARQVLANAKAILPALGGQGTLAQGAGE